MDITSICRRQNFDEFPPHFQVLFDIISLIEKSTSFLLTFFDVILIAEKSTLFRLTSLDVTSLVEKYTLFPLTFSDVILMVEKSALFALTTHFYEVSLVKKCNKPLLKKVKQRFLTKIDLRKTCTRSTIKIICAF